MARFFIKGFAIARCLCLCTASVEDSRDATLPAVNVKFDFATQDEAGGGRKAKRYAELRGFQQRASNLLRDADHDGEVLTTFAGVANQALDDLIQVISPTSALAAGISSGAPLGLSPQIVAEAESTLRSECGDACVEALNNILASDEFVLHNHSANGGAVALKLLADDALRQVAYSSRLEESFHASVASATHTHHAKLSSGGVLATDTACATNTLCKLKALIANKCNYGRQSLQLAYQALNVAAHVMSVLITLLCGCLYVHSTAVCVLQSIPPICVFPYNVYGKVYSGSEQLWEAVKGATKTCMIHGDATIAS